jgi:hypothetical protein
LICAGINTAELGVLCKPPLMVDVPDSRIKRLHPSSDMGFNRKKLGKKKTFLA